MCCSGAAVECTFRQKVAGLIPALSVSSLCSPPGVSVLRPRPKDIRIRLTGNSKLSVGVSANTNGCLSRRDPRKKPSDLSGV